MTKLDAASFEVPCDGTFRRSGPRASLRWTLPYFVLLLVARVLDSSPALAATVPWMFMFYFGMAAQSADRSAYRGAVRPAGRLVLGPGQVELHRAGRSRFWRLHRLWLRSGHVVTHVGGATVWLVTRMGGELIFDVRYEEQAVAVLEQLGLGRGGAPLDLALAVRTPFRGVVAWARTLTLVAAWTLAVFLGASGRLLACAGAVLLVAASLFLYRASRPRVRVDGRGLRVTGAHRTIELPWNAIEEVSATDGGVMFTARGVGSVELVLAEPRSIQPEDRLLELEALEQRVRREITRLGTAFRTAARVVTSVG